ncbi:hypoxanthine-guanine phosphoribosyltransferase [Spiribacter salinus M19-40]|jgi:hypoxanthine phosphoribosyltransferase|uniref:Hypoxanthine-guanine phosphoribosyltransferase n=1 Tax=Spiribacter salinus M19-40 TaxID=1260251 RepID=R4VK89_9GAMM|nr:hypoxanthine-guanine phosphoribosyltransferase [Spiribacter salinus]AGM40932.1 hypoxanthine-guanine phosphoribosyltransferase [Spiribacter salinus M19-40]MBY5268162.1 hypoxanthine-guanine phosphoribosyltransferase [Spiribacter salinus]
MSQGVELDATELAGVMARAECLHDAPAIEAALDRMGEAISTALSGTRPLLLGVMTGAIVPLGRLLSRLDFPLEVDYIHATRYHKTTTGRELVWLARPQTPLRGRHVLLVDDILDEGHTFRGLLEACQEEGAASVQTAVLADKPNPARVPGLKADFAGLTVPERYVFGVGMDYKGYLRNVNAIYAAHPDDED